MYLTHRMTRGDSLTAKTPKKEKKEKEGERKKEEPVPSVYNLPL